MPRGRKDIAQDGEKTQFSSDNQPENRGRRPSVLTYIKGSGLSLADYRRLLMDLIWEYDHKEIAALLKDKNNKIPMGMTIILGALLHDREKRSIDNYEKLMDRCFGKPTQGVDIKTSGDLEIVSMTTEERKKRIADLMKKARTREKKPGNEFKKPDRE
jgi:hypothetical protein